MDWPTVCPAVCSALIVLSCHAAPSDARDRALPPDLDPMLQHLAIASEMMRACGHLRPDLAAPLSHAWTAWKARNARVLEALATLRQDSLGEGASTAGVSQAEATEILDAYKTLQQILRREDQDQLRAGNTTLVHNCDEVLETFTCGRLHYHSPVK